MRRNRLGYAIRRLVPMLLLAASILPAGVAQAGPDAAAIVRAARASITVPPEWDGIWTAVDSIYTCAGAFQSTSTAPDTICGGRDYQTSNPGSPIEFDCTGSADATTFDMTCTGSSEIFTDCIGNYTMHTHATRTGDSYRFVTTIDVNYAGTGTGCEFVPPSCTQINSWGTRTGPAPANYCATAVRSSSWGSLKTRYR
jgi:hypothetical protein